LKKNLGMDLVFHRYFLFTYQTERHTDMPFVNDPKKLFVGSLRQAELCRQSRNQRATHSAPSPISGARRYVSEEIGLVTALV
jgi:hypothetical protein